MIWLRGFHVAYCFSDLLVTYMEEPIRKLQIVAAFVIPEKDPSKWTVCMSGWAELIGTKKVMILCGDNFLK